MKTEGITGSTSDGYHTFDELYDYRKAFNALLFNQWAALGIYDVHKSWRHSDGEPCFGGGWFIVVAQTPCGQISNHYKMGDEALFQIPTRERSAEYDGHTPQIALQRMLQLALGAPPDAEAAPSSDDVFKARYQWEKPALKIVTEIKAHLLPAMEEEEGGWILGMILDLCDAVRAKHGADSADFSRSERPESGAASRAIGVWYVEQARIILEQHLTCGPFAHGDQEQCYAAILTQFDELAHVTAPSGSTPAPQTTWQPITTAPKDRDIVLGAAPTPAITRWLVDVGRHETTGGVGEPLKHSWGWRWPLVTPTHWMSLPGAFVRSR